MTEEFDGVFGFDAKLYFDASGVGASDWSELSNCKDLTLNLTSDEADASTRANGEWKATLQGRKDASIEFEMVWNKNDAGFTAIKNAYINRATIGIAVMDGDIDTVGSEGLQANCQVMSFTRNEPLGEALTVNVTIKPTYSSTAPTWATVAAT